MFCSLSHLLLLLLATTLSSAAPSPAHVPRPASLIPRQDKAPMTRILVAGPGRIQGYTYDGTSFTPSPQANISKPGMAASWMVFQEPNLLYVNDESFLTPSLYHYDPVSGSLSERIDYYPGLGGVVHMAYNTDKTRLLATSYTEGAIDVYNTTDPAGLRQYKRIILSKSGKLGPNPRQDKLHPHQAVLDPTGRFFIVNDLGGDILHIIDTKDDAYSLMNQVPVTPAGSGPRHGAFISLDGGPRATHYVVACELANTLQLFSVGYNNNMITLMGIHTISSFGPGLGPLNPLSAAAGELVVSRSGPTYVYVSNRFTGNETDHIARFAIEAKSKTDTTPQLVFKGQVSTGGVAPRMFTMSSDEKQGTMFVANMYGPNALVAIGRAKDTGKMDANLLAKLPIASFSREAGPQFILAM